jgi:hypothetical protein
MEVAGGMEVEIGANLSGPVRRQPRIVTGRCLPVKHNGRPLSMRLASPTIVSLTVKLLCGWDDMRVPKQVRDYLSRLGRKGGPARSKMLTPAQRSDIARKAAQARWAKRPK